MKSNLAGGILKDPVDNRDYNFASYVENIVKTGEVALSSSLPTKISHRENMSPVKYQGGLGCHDIHTEILTENGWKLFKDLKKEEKVATINPDTHKIEYQKPLQYFEYDYKGNMFYFSHGAGLNAMVTPNHKMYVRQWDSKNCCLKDNYELVEAQNLCWYSSFLTEVNWDGNSPEYIKMPDVHIGRRNGAKEESIREGENIKTNDFMRFLGLYLAEGCVYHPKGTGSYRIEIAASDNNHRKAEVIDIIDKLPYKYTVYADRITIWNKSLFKYLEPLGNVYIKRVYRFIMNLFKEDIEAFLEGYYLGDGSLLKNGGRVGYSVSEGLIDDIQELELKVGRYARKKKRSGRISYIKGREINSKESYELHVRQKNTNLSIDRKKYLNTEVPYENKVYCVEVPNHILITRREGCLLISGNSCVAFAVASMKEWQEQQEYNNEIKQGSNYKREEEYYNLSEQWLYWNCKKIDPWGKSVEGTNIRSAMKVLNKIGVPPEKAWPYTDDKINIGEPEKWAGLISRWYTIGSYWRVDGVYNIKQALVDGPVVCGIKCYEEMFGKLDNGYIPTPAYSSKLIANHAICIVGYDDETERFTFKNSWSCYDENTEVLTENGFKLFKDLTKNEKLATLNKEGVIEYHSPIDYIDYLYEGEMYLYNNSKIDLFVTPNHNMYIQSLAERQRGEKNYKLIKAEDIKYKQIVMKRDGKWEAIYIEYFILPEIKIKTNKDGCKILPSRKIKMNDWLEFLGYFISEGSLSMIKCKKGGYQYKISISQKKKYNLKKIESCLERIGLTYHYNKYDKSFVLYDYQIYYYLIKLGKSHEKYIPKEFKNLKKDQLQILFDALMLGDGSSTRGENGSLKNSYYTSSPKLRDDFQELCLKIGLCSTVTEDDRVGLIRKLINKSFRYNYINYRINIQNMNNSDASQVILNLDKTFEKKNYYGNVYCVNIPNNVLFVRRNGKTVWCGNCFWGDRGYGHFSYKYAERYMLDAWAARDIQVTSDMLPGIRKL